MATYDMTTQTIDTKKLKQDDIINCPYSGESKSLILPSGTYKLECWGAMGGYRSNITYAGKGGYSIGTLILNDKTNIFLYTGGQGNNGVKTGNIYSGGFNGGGYRYGYYGGGGASDIRIGQDSLYARVIVAGGGGSDGATSKQGMYGGGESGGSSTQSYGSYGYGGTQTGNSGGSSYITTTQPTTDGTSSSNVYSGFGFAGMGVYRSSGYGGAGGSGWYGGTGSYPDSSGDDDRGGGGGSGYIYTESTATNYPSGCLLNSTYYLTEASMKSGNESITLPSGTTSTGNNDNGYIRITILSIVKNINMYIKIDNEWQSVNDAFIKTDSTWQSVDNILIKSNDIWG